MSTLTEPQVAEFDGWVREVQSLRDEIEPMPPVDAPPRQVHEHLLNVRQRLDRVEHLLSLSMRLRSLARRLAVKTAGEAQEDWDNAILRVRAQPTRQGGEFSSAKERYAEANLATLTAQRQARHAADVAQRADDAVEVIRLHHRALDAIRQDTLTVLRLLQFESHLER